MKTHLILMENRNENAGNPLDPVGELDGWNGETRILFNFGKGPVEVDLNEERYVCLSFDNDQLVPTWRWGIGRVTLPDWLTPRQWIRGQVSWRWFWGLGADKAWPEAWQRGLVDLGNCAQRLGCIRLLATNPARQRSALRISLRSQLIQWLETPPELRRYETPFSRKQWDYVANGYVTIESRRMESTLYWDRHDPAVEMVAVARGAGSQELEARSQNAESVATVAALV